MMKEFKGFSKVFAFTLRQQMKRKSFRVTFIVIALLCLVAPAVVMSLMEVSGGKDSPSAGDGIFAESTNVEMVVVVDQDTAHPVDYAVLNEVGVSAFSSIEYVTADDLNQAVGRASQKKAAILLVETTEDEAAGRSYQLNLLRTAPHSELEEEDLEELETFINAYFQVILLQKSGMNEQQLAVAGNPVQTQVHSVLEEAEGGESFSQIKSVLSFVLPYLIIMGLYFMILFYGQNVATSVIQEKTSKLMDNLLLSVRPAALVMGKMLAIFLTGVVQTLLWASCLAGGFLIGTSCVKAINPKTDMLLIQFFDSLDLFAGIFSIRGILFAAAIFLAGFLLYCSLSAVGGSLASKQEDLGMTNMMFTMILILSFLATLFGGVLEGSVPDWMLYIPFTAVLTAPGEALLGNLSVVQGSISLGILIVSAVIVVWIAGKVYSMMVLYKGNPPSIGKMFQMLKKNKK